MAEDKVKEEEKETYSPFHKTIDRVIMQSMVGIGGSLKRDKTTELVTLFGLLCRTKLPVDEGKKLAENMKEYPNFLRQVNEPVVAEFIEEVIADLKTR
jgi:hypothetical protein